MASKTIRFENVDSKDIMYRNFAGKAGTFNNEGDRSFCMRCTEDEANELIELGFYVRERKKVNEDGTEDKILYLPIKVNMNSTRPPQINQITKNGITRLDSDTVNVLDWADIIKADIAINPYHYHYGNKDGISAYLTEMLVEIEDESFLSRYLREHNE